MTLYPGYSIIDCHNSAGDKLIDEWKKYLETSQIKEEYGNDEVIMTLVQNLFEIDKEYDSLGYVDLMDAGPYAGRLRDDNGVVFTSLNTQMDHVPMDTVKNYFDELVRIYCAR